MTCTPEMTQMTLIISDQINKDSRYKELIIYKLKQQFERQQKCRIKVPMKIKNNK